MKLTPTIFAEVMIALTACSRTNEFRAQAQAGQPIVLAIENYRKDTGNYPTSLTDLVPKYLATAPDMPDPTANKRTGWEYNLMKDRSKLPYILMYYMGRGGVEYEPPNWFGNDEGNRTVVLSNK